VPHPRDGRPASVHHPARRCRHISVAAAAAAAAAVANWPLPFISATGRRYWAQMCPPGGKWQSKMTL